MACEVCDFRETSHLCFNDENKLIPVSNLVPIQIAGRIVDLQHDPLSLSFLCSSLSSRVELSTAHIPTMSVALTPTALANFTLASLNGVEARILTSAST